MFDGDAYVLKSRARGQPEERTGSTLLVALSLLSLCVALLGVALSLLTRLGIALTRGLALCGLTGATLCWLHVLNWLAEEDTEKGVRRTCTASKLVDGRLERG